MAHFAELDENSNVLRVIVINNGDILDEYGNESEDIGIELCKKMFGDNTIWKQTSYNHKFRKGYASFGMVYIPEIDCFLSPKPHESWSLNTIKKEWEAPIPYPDDGNQYVWNEDLLEWIIENHNYER